MPLRHPHVRKRLPAQRRAAAPGRTPHMRDAPRPDRAERRRVGQRAEPVQPVRRAVATQPPTGPRAASCPRPLGIRHRHPRTSAPTTSGTKHPPASPAAGHTDSTHPERTEGSRRERARRGRASRRTFRADGPGAVLRSLPPRSCRLSLRRWLRSAYAALSAQAARTFARRVRDTISPPGCSLIPVCDSRPTHTGDTPSPRVTALPDRHGGYPLPHAGQRHARAGPLRTREAAAPWSPTPNELCC